jgi:hypothetical protein
MSVGLGTEDLVAIAIISCLGFAQQSLKKCSVDVAQTALTGGPGSFLYFALDGVHG